MATDQIETPAVDEVVADQIETPVVDEVATDQIETPVIDEVVINNKSLEYSLLRSYDMNVYTYKKFMYILEVILVNLDITMTEFQLVF